MPTAEEVVPVLTKLGVDASAAPVETGDKVWALASIATLLADENQHNLRLLLTNKVVPRVLYALKSDTNLEVRREASGALRNLCMSDDDRILDEIVSKGGIDAVLSVLKWAALGLQSHERRLERARAPLLEERERLMAKPLDQMNRKERRHMAKLSQGKLPSATAGATVDFGGDAHDVLDMHAWGTDAPASLKAMDSTAAQCLIETCESLVTVLSCLCELSEKVCARALQWSWNDEGMRSAFVSEPLAAWLCEALALGTRACVCDTAHDAELAELPECVPALVSLGLACAQALWIMSDVSEHHDMARGIAGLCAASPPSKAAMPTPSDARAALERGMRRIDILVRASACLAPNAHSRAAMLGANASGAIVQVYAAVREDEEAPEELRSSLAAFVQQDMLVRVANLLADANVDVVREEARSALEVCLELVGSAAQVIPNESAESTLGAATSPLVLSVLRLAKPSDVSTHDTAEGSARRASETRALAALNNVLWHTALCAPPPPSEWPADDEDALAYIHAWRASAGTLFLEGDTPVSTPVYTSLRQVWDAVFDIAAFWAGVESVANAPKPSHRDVTSVASDGLAQVSTSIGCLWSVARMLEGQLPLLHETEPIAPVSALPAAYDSALDASVRVKVLGTMACLARSQYFIAEHVQSVPTPYMQVYAHIASFWADAAGHVPDAETLAALIHAVVDTYADERAPWDPAYNETHLHERLCTHLPQYMAMAKKVDRRADPALYRAVQDSIDTLRAFVQYRQDLA